MYHINLGIWSGIFAVPNTVVDQHIKLCSALQLKVLLLLLRYPEGMEISSLSQLLGQSEADIKDALHYWIESGIIQQPDSPQATVELSTPTPVLEPVQTSTPMTPPQIVAPTTVHQPEPASPGETKKVRTERFRRMNRQDVLECSQRDSQIGILLQESQNILGRILSNGESEMIVSLYYHYGMQPDILLMLLEYCRCNQKDTPAYIEKMALDWVNREITSHERVEEELMRLSKRSESEENIRQMFGIYGRSLSDKELEYYKIWTVEWKMSESMIKLAYEKTINAKGQISFPYINAILSNWNTKNLQTPDQVLREENAKSSSKDAKNSSQPKPSYNLDKMDELITQGNIWD